MLNFTANKTPRVPFDKIIKRENIGVIHDIFLKHLAGKRHYFKIYFIIGIRRLSNPPQAEDMENPERWRNKLDARIRSWSVTTYYIAVSGREYSHLSCSVQ